jgi:uncharacterized protein (TIGR00369 family)
MYDRDARDPTVRDARDPRLRDVADRLSRSAFHRWAGIALARAEPGEVEVVLRAGEHHLNIFGTIHGGMVSTLADTAMGLAMRTRLEPGTTHVTAQLDVHFLRPGTPGRISAIGRAVKSGRQMGYAEAEVFDEGGRTLARASGTFLMLRGRRGPGSADRRGDAPPQ